MKLNDFLQIAYSEPKLPIMLDTDDGPATMSFYCDVSSKYIILGKKTSAGRSLGPDDIANFINLVRYGEKATDTPYWYVYYKSPEGELEEIEAHIEYIREGITSRPMWTLVEPCQA